MIRNPNDPRGNFKEQTVSTEIDKAYDVVEAVHGALPEITRVGAALDDIDALGGMAAAIAQTDADATAAADAKSGAETAAATATTQAGIATTKAGEANAAALGAAESATTAGNHASAADLAKTAAQGAKVAAEAARDAAAGSAASAATHETNALGYAGAAAASAAEAAAATGFDPALYYSKTAADGRYLQTVNFTFANLGSKPTTLAGYGITDAESISNRNVANGYAGLDATGKIAAAQLPAYVDDVLEYDNLGAFPGTGSSGLIYVATNTNKTYRWSGSGYTEISASPGSTDAVPEGATNLYFTQTRARAAVSATGAITYNSSTGVFSIDLSGYLTTTAAAAAYQPLDADLTSIAGLAGTNGLLKKTGANTWALDTSAYITGSSPTITDPAITGTITEDIYTIADGAAFEIDPGNGSIQMITLGASRTPKATNMVNGESVVLGVDDGTAYTLTWTDTTFGASGVKWLGGSAPSLAASGYTWITLWKVGGQVYGSSPGSSA